MELVAHKRAQVSVILWNVHIVFQVYISRYSYWLWVPSSPQTYQHWLFLFFMMYAGLTGVICLLSFISHIKSDEEYFLYIFSHLHVFFEEAYVYLSPPHIFWWVGCFHFCKVLLVLYILEINPLFNECGSLWIL